MFASVIRVVPEHAALVHERRSVEPALSVGVSLGLGALQLHVHVQSQEERPGARDQAGHGGPEGLPQVLGTALRHRAGDRRLVHAPLARGGEQRHGSVEPLRHRVPLEGPQEQEEEGGAGDRRGGRHRARGHRLARPLAAHRRRHAHPARRARRAARSPLAQPAALRTRHMGPTRRPCPAQQVLQSEHKVSNNKYIQID